MFVLPSDHLITHPQIFRKTLSDASSLAEKGDKLVTIGITPTYPETGYGYIKFDPSKTIASAYAVESFVEKPDVDTAKEYIQSQLYLWNSGMFTWKASSILSNINKMMPDMYSGLINIYDSIDTEREEAISEEEFCKFRSVSIDYGIMEKADNIYVISGAFGWDDVGSWLAIERLQQQNDFGNIIAGNVVSVDTKNTIIQGGERLIALIGIKNLVIVDTEDAILISDKNSINEIKKITQNLRICNKTEYL